MLIGTLISSLTEMRTIDKTYILIHAHMHRGMYINRYTSTLKRVRVFIGSIIGQRREAEFSVVVCAGSRQGALHPHTEKEIAFSSCCTRACLSDTR